MKQFIRIAVFQDHGPMSLWSEITGDRMRQYLNATYRRYARYSCQQLPIPEAFRVTAGIDWMELASVSTGNVSEFAFFCRSKQGSKDKNYCNIIIAEAMVNKRHYIYYQHNETKKYVVSSYLKVKTSQ